jgi:two-component sensor histidine kinase
LQLVSDLVRQLEGRLEVGAGPGAMFVVTFAPILGGGTEVFRKK